MNIVIVPWYPSNPYQEQLARHLEEKGASVTLLSIGAFLNPATVSRLKPDVLHLHWLQPYATTGNIFKSWAKLAIFMSHVYMLRSRGVKIVWT